MGAVARIRTEAENELIRQFAGHDAPVRAAAFAQFEQVGLPHRRVESWHYTDLRTKMRSALPLAPEAKKDFLDALIASEQPNKAGRVEPRLFIVNGRFVEALSDVKLLPEGVSLRALAESDLGLRLPVGMDDDALVALNTAFVQGGMVIDIAAGAEIEGSIHVVSIVADGLAAQSYARVIVKAGKGAKARIVETHHGRLAGAHQKNSMLVFEIADGAEIQHVARYDYENAEAQHVASFGAILGAGALLESFALGIEGALTRRQLFVRFEGEHSRISLNGAALLKGRQHFDTTLVVDHAAAHCESRERFKQIVDGEGSGVYQGKVVVRPGAQKTDGAMKSDTILLADGATMDNKPELEIFADDVVCGHGATCGELNPDHIFYLRSRGLSQSEAEALLLEAFVGEVIETVQDERLAESLRADVLAWLAARRS